MSDFESKKIDYPVPGDSPAPEDVDTIVKSHESHCLWHKPGAHDVWSGIDMERLMKEFNNTTIPPQNRPGGIGGHPSNDPAYRATQFKFFYAEAPIKPMKGGLSFSYLKKDGEWSVAKYPICNSKQFGASVANHRAKAGRPTFDLSGASRRIPYVHDTLVMIADRLARAIAKSMPREVRESVENAAGRCRPQSLVFGGLWTTCSMQVDMTAHYHRDTHNVNGVSTVVAWSPDAKDAGVLSLPDRKLGLRYTPTTLTHGCFCELLHGTLPHSLEHRVSLVFFCATNHLTDTEKEVEKKTKARTQRAARAISGKTKKVTKRTRKVVAAV